MIRTVSGDITPGELGFCQSHEHIFIRPSPAIAGEVMDDKEKSLAELDAYRKAGGISLVDAQPPGTGRDCNVLKELSLKSGVNIIASTGFQKLSFYPKDHWLYSASEGELFNFFCAEIEEGMFADGDDAFPCKKSAVKAGQIKTALDAENLSAPCQKLFLAAAKTAKKTGRPLMAHIERGSDPIALADFLEKENVSPEKIIFCHLDRAVSDIEIHKEICRRGIYLEYDTIARPKYHDDSFELKIILKMLDAGFRKNLLLGLDTTRLRLKSYGGSPGLCYIRESFIPLMKDNGISETGIQSFFVENPARVFG